MSRKQCPCGKAKKTDQDGKKDGQRQQWSRHIEFILALVGNAVGIGNILRFPYICMRNGGGAFLIAYTFAMVIFGIPLSYLEVALGQFSGLNGVNMYGNMIPLFKGIGLTIFTVQIIFLPTYGQVVTWVWYYLGMSFSKTLPWTNCNNTWNTENCFVKFDNGSNITEVKFGNNTTDYNLTTLVPTTMMSPGEEFLQYNVLELTDGVTDFGGLRWQLVVCHIVTWVLLCACFVKGIHSFGKAAYLMATAPYVILTVLLIRGALLPGSLTGIMYYIKPNWSSLLEFKIWTEAAIQIFYSVATFAGSIITISSYNDFHRNCHRDAYTVVIINCLTSLYGGFAVFSVLGYMSYETGVPVDKVLKSGPGLAFILYPEALSKLPLPQLWSVLFFLTLATLGYGTMAGNASVVLTALEDKFPRLFRRQRKWLLSGYFVWNTLIGLLYCSRSGMYWFQIFEWYLALSLFVGAVFGVFGMAWIYGLDRIFNDIAMMSGVRPSFIYKIFWGFLSPVYLLVCFVYSTTGLSKPNYGSYEYPAWAIALAWVVPIISVMQIPLFATIGIVKTKGSFRQRLKILITPTKRWGPQDEKYRNEYNLSKEANKNGEPEELQTMVA